VKLRPLNYCEEKLYRGSLLAGFKSPPPSDVTPYFLSANDLKLSGVSDP